MQIVHSSHRGSRDIEHIGSARDDAELEILKAVARQRLAAGQGELNLGPGFGGQSPGGPLPITSSRMGHLLDALGRGYDVLGFGLARHIQGRRCLDVVESSCDGLRDLELLRAEGVQGRRARFVRDTGPGAGGVQFGHCPGLPKAAPSGH